MHIHFDKVSFYEFIPQMNSHILWHNVKNGVLLTRGPEAGLGDTRGKESSNVWDSRCLSGEPSKQLSSGGSWWKITRCWQLLRGEKWPFKSQGRRREEGHGRQSEACVEREVPMKHRGLRTDGARRGLNRGCVNCLQTESKENLYGQEAGLWSAAEVADAINKVWIYPVSPRSRNWSVGLTYIHFYLKKKSSCTNILYRYMWHNIIYMYTY